jgi:F-type H+-transporting ATPase subunit epsilon
MSTFSIQVVSLDGQEYTGNVQRIRLRTIDGDVAILAGHTNYCTAIGMGTAELTLEDSTKRSAACIGGMLSVMDGVCRVLPTTWEWDNEIDVERAQRAKDRAEEKLRQQNLSEQEKVRTEAKLYRALVRLGTVSK